MDENLTQLQEHNSMYTRRIWCIINRYNSPPSIYLFQCSSICY